MEYCRKKYREAYNRQSWDSEDEEDAKKIADQEAKLERDSKRVAMGSRRRTVRTVLSQ